MIKIYEARQEPKTEKSCSKSNLHVKDCYKMAAWNKPLDLDCLTSRIKKGSVALASGSLHEKKTRNNTCRLTRSSSNTMTYLNLAHRRPNHYQ